MLRFRRVYYKKYALTVLCGICVLFFWKFCLDILSFNWAERAADDHRTLLSTESRIWKLKSECQRLQEFPGGLEKVKSGSLSPASFVDNVFINKRYGLLYCSVAKIGTSFWKRVFKVLDESNSRKLHLYDMKSTSAHSNIPDSMTLRNTTLEDFKNILATYMKFIFVRDPFARLFSAYVDKILIPTPVQLNMINFFRDQNLTTSSKLPCNRKVSFGEFSSLLAEAMLQKNIFEQHFSTISSQCEPCKFDFTVVGKMETFLTDVREIFHRAHIDISEVIGDIEDIDTTNEVSCIKDVVERVFKYYLSRPIGCVGHLETADRLWKHLQIRGFISKSIPLPLDQSKDSVFSLENYSSAAIRAYKQSEPRDIRMRQREEAMMEAYSLVPRETLEKLARVFAEDCSLFGYSCDIEIFLNHKAPLFYFKIIQ